MKLLAIFLLLFTCFLYISEGKSLEKYTEYLEIEQLKDGKVLLTFSFQNIFELDIDKLSNFNKIPRTLIQVVQSHAVNELIVSFTTGRWDYKKWGPGPTWLGAGRRKGETLPHSVGVEAWADFKFSKGNKQQKWRSLTHALSGLTCASINFLGASTNTLVRQVNSSLIGGKLSREAVCTENLSPWTKLLPCRQKSGLASVINPYSLYKADFTTMALRFDAAAGIIEQTLVGVLDPVRNGHLEHQETLSMDIMRNQTWSLKSLLDQTLTEVCSAADETVLKLRLPPQSALKYEFFEKLPEPNWAKLAVSKQQVANDVLTFSFKPLGKVYEKKIKRLNDGDADQDGFDLGLLWHSPAINMPHMRAVLPVGIKRTFTGYGQESAGIRIFISTANADSSLYGTLVHPVPWWLKLWMHTLTIKVFSATGELDAALSANSSVTYIPSKRRESPALLQISMNLEPRALVQIDVQTDFEHLRVAEHPPGASRGFDLWPAELLVSSKYSDLNYTLYTTPLLMRMPTPDFSMPYNVITLTCTILALFFGSSLNALVRKLQPVKVKKQLLSPSDAAAIEAPKHTPVSPLKPSKLDKTASLPAASKVSKPSLTETSTVIEDKRPSASAKSSKDSAKSSKDSSELAKGAGNEKPALKKTKTSTRKRSKRS